MGLHQPRDALDGAQSLSADDVYAVLAYLLNLGHVVPDDFTLSDRNIREVQQRLPNRNGITTVHGMWPGPEFGVIAAPTCRGRPACATAARPRWWPNQIPDYARNAHGEGERTDAHCRAGARRPYQPGKKKKIMLQPAPVLRRLLQKM